MNNPTLIANEIIRTNSGRNPVCVRNLSVSGMYANPWQPQGFRAYAGSFTEALAMAAHRLRTNAINNLHIVSEVR
jgi:hypothetical protein